MDFEWNSHKNLINICTHGIDFHDVGKIFEQPMLRKIDRRKDYNGPQKLDHLLRCIILF
jgi:uncharacterized DUF497 family protein